MKPVSLMTTITALSLSWVAGAQAQIDGRPAEAEVTPVQGSADANAPADPAVQPYATIAVSTAPAAPIDARESDHDEIEEVMVTATKRAKSAREIPVTINAVKGEDLERSGARSLNEFIGQVPGITVSDSSSGEAGGRNITIRGVGPGDASGSSGNSGNQTVGQFIGDVPLTDPYSNFVTPDLIPYDLKSVEILKGPQGTTFGASALNGAIRYVPNAPELGRWSARGYEEYLSISEGGAGFDEGAALNVPLGDTLAFRAVGVYENVPGVYDNIMRKDADADNKIKWSGRGALRWEPMDRLSVNLMYLQQYTHQYDVLAADNGNGVLANDRQPGPSTIKTGFDVGSLDARYRFDDIGTLVLQSSVEHKNSLLDLDPGITGEEGIQSLRAEGIYHTKGYTYEARIVSPDGGDWNWIGGAYLSRYYAHATANLYVVDSAFLPAGFPLGLTTGDGLTAATTHVDPVANERSVYGELSRKFGDQWEVTLGARLYDTVFSGSRDLEGVTSVALLGANVAQIDQSNKGVSPKASVVYKYDANLMSYLTVARGFQFGGANAPAVGSLPYSNPATGTAIPVSFKPSSIWSGELGLRTTWLEKTLEADVTGFFLDWTNAQFGQTSGGLLNNAYIDNVGKVYSRGVEGSLVYLTPIRGLSFNFAGSYILATTAKEYVDGSGNAVPTGTEMPSTPKVQTASTLAYNVALGPWVSTASLLDTYCGPAFNNIDHQATIFDFNTVNVGLGVARPDWAGMPSLTVNGTNLTDKRNLLSYNAGGTTSGPAWVYGRPLAVSLMLSLEFN